jgi:hypothetical protein
MPGTASTRSDTHVVFEVISIVVAIYMLKVVSHTESNTLDDDYGFDDF